MENDKPGVAYRCAVIKVLNEKDIAKQISERLKNEPLTNEIRISMTESKEEYCIKVDNHFYIIDTLEEIDFWSDNKVEDGKKYIAEIKQITFSNPEYVETLERKKQRIIKRKKEQIELARFLILDKISSKTSKYIECQIQKHNQSENYMPKIPVCVCQMGRLINIDGQPTLNIESDNVKYALYYDDKFYDITDRKQLMVAGQSEMSLGFEYIAGFEKMDVECFAPHSRKDLVNVLYNLDIVSSYNPEEQKTRIMRLI